MVPSPLYQNDGLVFDKVAQMDRPDAFPLLCGLSKIVKCQEFQPIIRLTVNCANPVPNITII